MPTQAPTLLRALSAAFLLLATAPLFAADTDGDGIPDKRVAKVDVQNNVNCALDGNGAHCWPTGTVPSSPALVNPTSISSGGSGFACALDDDGAHCWGANNYGQSTVPTLISPVAVSAGFIHACALDDGGVHCWGYNGLGQTDVPNDLVNPVVIDAGERNTCAIDDTGVRCWGNDNQSQVSGVPNDLVNPVAVSVGTWHICALDDSGVHCWGNGSEDDVPSLANPVAVSVGTNYTCAIDDNGVQCWGGNASFNGVSIPTLVNPIAVGVGDSHACALDDNGVHCWGDNTYNQTDVPSDLVFNSDNCPRAVNADQADTDGDGLGDTCDPLPLDGNVLNNENGTAKADKAGTVVAFAGDFNGDGFGDYVVGMPGYDVPASPPAKALKNAGRVEVISGNNGSVLYFHNGATAGGALGTAVAGNADINGDHIPDVIASAPLADAQDGSKNKTGKIKVVYGCQSVGCTPATDDMYGSEHAIEPKALWGAALALGDVDNDGLADVVVGIPNATNTQLAKPLKQAGCVAVYSGAVLHQIIPIMGSCGETAKAHAGAAVASGDTDGLPGAEIIVGAPNDKNESAKNAGSVALYTFGDSFPLITKYGSFAKDGFGSALAVSTHSGSAVVLIGAPGADNGKIKNAGAAYLVFTSGSITLLRIGSEANAQMGTSVAIGDTNGDAVDDFILGALKGDSPTAPKSTKDTGSVFVLNGINGSTVVRYGDKKGDSFGRAVSAGDINADGKADILVGIPGKDVTVTIDGKPKVLKDAGGVTILNATAL